MIIFPAIDIKEGKVVRLMQGKFDKVTEYGDNPATVAKQWEEQGAEWLHLVDLDGAKTGQMQNFEAIQSIVDNVTIPVQVGGGIRTEEDIHRLIEINVSRIIIGTRAIEDRAFFKEVVERYGDRIALSLDCSNGMVAQRGWVSTSDVKATDLVQELEAEGLKCIIYTDIARDGMLTGPNYEGLEELLDLTNIPIIASGGVANIEDIKKLKSLEDKGVLGAITGKAIYEGKLDLKEALTLC